MRNLWLPPGRYVPIRAAGLDVDGVMRDTGHNAYQSLCKVIKKKGGRVPTYAEYLARDINTVTFCAEMGVVLSDEELERLYYGVHPPDHLTAPYADVAGFCKALGALGLDLFVVSSSRADWIVDWFDDHSLGTHFAQVVHSAGRKHLHLSRICDELGVDPSEVAYVGDRGVDMFAAVEAKTIPIGITRGYSGAEKALRQSGAQMVVHSLEHLAYLIA